MELTEREWEIIRRALWAYDGSQWSDGHYVDVLRSQESALARDLYHRLTAIPVR